MGELLLILWDVFWPVAILTLIFVAGYFLISYGIPILLGGTIKIALIPFKMLFKRIIAIPSRIKLEKRFNEGLEQQLAKYIPKDAMVIEFQTAYIRIKAYNGNWYLIHYYELGYENFPNVRYCLAMAQLVNKRILKEKRFLLREMYSSSEGGFVSNGYNTTSTIDGYHTTEDFTYIPSETSTYGYKLVNLDYIKVEKKPTIKKW